MKRIITIAALILGIAFTPSYQQQPKLLKVEADIKQWNDILNIIDLSAAEPTARVAAKNFIINQLNQQMKPPIDSSKLKK